MWKRKKILIAALAVLLLIPTTAFTYQSLLADEIYGSWENMQKKFVGFTMEKYLLFNAKLSQAKSELSKEEYAEFKRLIQDLAAAKIEYADEFGNIDYDQLPAEKVNDLKQAIMLAQPYFDKLNQDRSSKEVLTADQFEQYIDALMTYEKILAQSGLDTSTGFLDEDIPAELRDEYMRARDFIRYVSDKQRP